MEMEMESDRVSFATRCHQAIRAQQYNNCVHRIETTTLLLSSRLLAAGDASCYLATVKD